MQPGVEECLKALEELTILRIEMLKKDRDVTSQILHGFRSRKGQIYGMLRTDLRMCCIQDDAPPEVRNIYDRLKEL